MIAGAGDARVPTLADLFARYEAERQEKWSLRTRAQQHGLFQEWVKAFDDCPLIALSPERISAWCETLQTSVAPGTVVRYWQALAAPLAAAVRYGWLAASPMHALCKPVDDPFSPHYLITHAEEARLFQACAVSRSPHLGLLIQLALATGARKHELLTMAWWQMDHDEGCCLFPGTGHRSFRRVPMGPSIQAAFAQRRHREQPEPEMLIFPGRTAARPVKIHNAFERACRAADLAHLRFQDIRYTVTQRWLAAGMDLGTVMRRLGYAQVPRFVVSEAWRGSLPRATHKQAPSLLRMSQPACVATFTAVVV
jgi:integrase